MEIKSINYKQIVVGELLTNCFLLYSESDSNCLIIDPGAEAEVITSCIRELDLNPLAVVLTHAHLDHCSAAADIISGFQIPLLVHKEDEALLNSAGNRELAAMLNLPMPPTPDKLFQGGQLLKFQSLQPEVIYTPGHTPGSVCLKINNLLFTGDTLFHSGIGRTDLPGGNYSQIQASLLKLTKLAKELIVLPGHGELSSIGQEIKLNPFL